MFYIVVSFEVVLYHFSHRLGSEHHFGEYIMQVT